MAILRFKIIFLIIFPFLLSSCLVNPDGTITIISPVESDTFISSNSSADHSNLNYLSVLRSGTSENRILVKLPTGRNDYNSHLDSCLGDPFCAVFFMPLAILGAILAPNCRDESFTAANLNWAYLEFETVDGASPAVGSLNINLVAQPWWHDVTWTRTHPFSSQGSWTTPGGTLDTSVNFDTNCTNLQGGQTCGAGEVKFDMTAYMTTLLNNPNSTHYGLSISSPVDIAEIRFNSSQSSGFGRPSLVANYNCITTATVQTSRVYLGDPL